MGMIMQNEKMFGGTSDYENLNNKPKINNVELSGNKTTSELGIPTNAELLPIESGSATNTKDYIDSKLSSYLYTLSTSDFTWDNSGRYVSNYTIDHYIGSKSVKMMSVYSTNGDAIMNSRLSGSNYINVLGLKTDGTAITSAYQFSLTILAI